MPSDFFKDVAQWEFDWRGARGRLPVFYYDNTSMTAIYTAGTAKVRPLLPHPDMRPIEVRPGRCLAAFTAFEYRRSDIDPYNEFSISFPITFGRRSIPGVTIAKQMLDRRFSAYVWKLPVTTEIARVGGVDLYGYPKFIADIVFSRDGGWVECRLSEKGDEILTLRGRALRTKPGAVMQYVTYSIKDGVPLKANVFVNPLEFAMTNRGSAASVSLGENHEVSRTLKGIGLGAAPLLYQYSPVNEAILFGGRNLMDD